MLSDAGVSSKITGKLLFYYLLLFLPFPFLFPSIFLPFSSHFPPIFLPFSSNFPPIFLPFSFLFPSFFNSLSFLFPYTCFDGVVIATNALRQCKIYCAPPNLHFIMEQKLEDSVRMDHKPININTRNWSDSAQDRDYWRALVNSGLNLWIP